MGMCVYTCVCTRVWACVCACVYVYIVYMCAHVNMYVCICVYIWVCVHIYIHIYMCVCVCLYVCAHVWKPEVNISWCSLGAVFLAFLDRASSLPIQHLFGTYLTMSAGQQAPGISIYPRFSNARAISAPGFFTRILGLKLGSPCLCDNYLSNWAISPTLQASFLSLPHDLQWLALTLNLIGTV